MRTPRISIAGLMGFIALVGVTLSASLVATEFCESLMLSLALAASGVALLGRLSSRDADAATWTGFLVFGTGYLALCVGPWCEEHTMPDLVTTPLIDAQYDEMHYIPTHTGERVWTSEGPGRGFVGGHVFGDVDPEMISFGIVHDRGTTSRYLPAQIRPISPASFRRLCHSVISLWAGLLGSLLARSLFGVRRAGTGGDPEGQQR